MKKTLFFSLLAVVFLLTACQSDSEKQSIKKEVKQVIINQNQKMDNRRILGLNILYVNSNSAVAEYEVKETKVNHSTPVIYTVYQSVIKKGGQWKLADYRIRK